MEGKKTKMFRAVGLIGFVACMIICSGIPALAGEMGWGIGRSPKLPGTPSPPFISR